MEDELISLESLADFFHNSIDLPELRTSLSSIFGNSVVDSIFIGEACHYDIDGGFILSAYIGLPINLELGIPANDLIKIKLGLPNQQLVVNKFIFFFKSNQNIPSWRLFLKDINVSIVFDNTILRRVNPDDSEPIGSAVTIKTSLSINQNLNLFIEPAEASLPLSYIGNTNFKISAEKIKFILNTENPEVSLKELKFIPPQDLFQDNLLMPAFSINEAVINKNGFTGTVEIAWNLIYQGEEFLIDIENEDGIIERKSSTLFSIPGGIEFFKIQFENNFPISSEIKGLIRIPHFDKDIAVSIIFDRLGEFKLSLDSLNLEGILISKEDLVSLYLKSLIIDKEERSISISGGLQPLLFTSEGMKWPRMDVKNLKINSAGEFTIDEAWLDLKEMSTLDLFGFKLELRKIGLGTDRDKLWIDLSGGLKLIEQVPIGVDIEGFRIAWPQDTSQITSLEQLSRAIEIQFKGVELSFGVPNAIQLDGLIRFFKDATVTGFAGDMVLVIPPAGIKAEAGLMVGMNAEQPNPYPFFYVYFGLEAAAGIPLGQSGLALKGAIGLFGINVSPNRQEGQNWYYDWYKKAPAPGAHQTTKWGDERDALAVGAGVTITTVDGVVKGTKGIIVLALPGPILVINGKALIFDGLNPNPNAEPPFSATAIFDGREKIVQFNIEAQAALVENVVDAYAGVEAFFDFKDITNWHLYLGQDVPVDRRIRANILNIVEADAYLMLDMLDADRPRARMGVEVNIRPEIPSICFEHPFGEECIRFEAYVNFGGNGEISVRPEQFSGNAFLEAGIDVHALGLKVEIDAFADISIEGPSPFSLRGKLGLEADLPDPLPDYEDTYEFELKIPKVEFIVSDPLQSVSAFSRFTSESKELTSSGLNTFARNRNREFLQSSVLVECDINPIISFEKEMNQDYNFFMSPGGIKTFDIGAIEVTPTLRTVIIREKDKDSNNNEWRITYSTVVTDNKPILGSWLIENDPSSPARPASRRLQLLTLNPLSNTAHYSGNVGIIFMNDQPDTLHLSNSLLLDYPNAICGESSPSTICFGFRYLGKPISKTLIKWSGVTFTSPQLITIVDECLQAYNTLSLNFEDRVVKVKIVFCGEYQDVKFKPSVKSDAEKFKDGVSDKVLVYLDDTKFSVTKINSSCYEVSSEEGSFEHLEIQSKSKQGIQIKSVCFTGHKEYADFEVNQEQCKRNRELYPSPSTNNDPSITLNFPSDAPIFQPGRYYEIEIQYSLSGNLIENRIQEENLLIRRKIITDYQNALSSFPVNSTKYVYFQTDAPPQNLEPYIKWSVPENLGKNVYTEEPVHFRFKRGYLKSLYAGLVIEEYRLKVYLKGTDGVIHELKNFSFDSYSSDASTLYPDEEAWVSHLRQNRLDMGMLKDDILTINLPSSIYKTNNRYELLLVGQKIGNTISNNNSKNGRVINIERVDYNLLASRSITTSRFSTFREMVSSVGFVETEENGELLQVRPILEEGKNTEIPFSFDDIIVRSKDYFKGKIDYEFGVLQVDKEGTLLFGKEALEELKYLNRVAQDKLDEVFREKAIFINPQVYFGDSESRMQVNAIKLENTELIGFIWIKFPERINFSFNQNGMGNYRVDLFGRGLKGRVRNLASQMICNSDTTQIIFKLNTPINISQIGNIGLRITFKRDFGDDRSNAEVVFPGNELHHRYDRPSIKGGETEVIEIGLV